MKKYIAKDIESEIAQKWTEENVYKTPDSTGNASDKGKVYSLVMFPYPSGAGLHTGHARVYTGTDVLARYYRMNGKAVLHPMGWDAFGLPAENAAVKQQKNPMDMVPENIANFKSQMQHLGLSYDWSREFSTTDPEYYKWTQWLFIQFFKMGLLHKQETPIFYCPSCKTGLAQEEVLANGTHERCGNMVEERVLPQWIFRITKYAEELLADLDGLDWPNGILQMQRNWIGKKEGVELEFAVENSETVLSVFTTRLDTIEGVTFLVLSPKKGEALGLGNTEKDTGLTAINPITHEKIPVWIAEYVIDDVGTGVVMGVPEHDERDKAFAQKHKLPIKSIDLEKGAEFASKALTEGVAKKKTTFHLRDWIFSRQRYWGEPIPMVFCQKCADEKVNYWNSELAEKLDHNMPQVGQKISGFVDEIKDSLYGWFPVADENLPLELPYVKSYLPTDSGESPLSQIPEFVNTTCPNCASFARRETDTMPNWAGSCWYFLYFARDLQVSSATPSVEGWKELIQSTAKDWTPVDWYIGGAEHAVLHLLYARFWTKALHDVGLVNFTEPFTRLRNVGIVLASDNRKMSKSLGNVINPDDVVDEFGADTLRVYEMFMAPFNAQVAWSTAAMQGAYRFITRIWHMFYSSDKIAKNGETSSATLAAELQSVIASIDSDITNVKFNTSISTLMKFLNMWEQDSSHKLSENDAKQFLKLLAPFAPFMTDYIWRDVFGQKESIHIAAWPQADSSLLQEKQVTMGVQVNGKVRGTITLQTGKTDQETALKEALKLEGVQRFVGDKQYKLVYVPGRVMNFVIE